MKELKGPSKMVEKLSFTKWRRRLCLHKWKNSGKKLFIETRSNEESTDESEHLELHVRTVTFDEILKIDNKTSPFSKTYDTGALLQPCRNSESIFVKDQVEDLAVILLKRHKHYSVPPGEEKVSGSDDKTTGTPALATGTAAERENQAVPVSVTPIHKKKYWMRKSARLVREETPTKKGKEEGVDEAGYSKAGPSQEEEEEEAELINEVGRGIDKAIGKGAQALSLWRELLSGMKERYPFKEDATCHPGKWTTMERGIQYLRELVMLEAIYDDLDNEQLSKNPDEVKCTRPMWQKFVRSAPPLYASSLAVVTWKDGVEEGDNWVYQTVWIRWPGTSDPQEYKALVDTDAQCTLMPSRYKGAKPLCISGVTAGVSLTVNEWQKHPIVPGPEAPCILGIDYLRRGYFKDPKGYWWAFDIAALEMEEIKQLSTLPSLSEDPSVVGLLRVEEQRVLIATTTSQGAIMRKSNGEWRLTVDCRSLNEVTPPLSAAVLDMLELQYELESKAAKPQFAVTWRGVQYTWNRLPQGQKHSPAICHGLIQTALEQGEAPEHLQYIDDIIVWGNTAEEVFEKAKKIVQILLKAGFAVKQSKVKGPAQEIQFLGIKWQGGRRQIPIDVTNKITAMPPPTSRKETQAFLVVGTEAQLLLASRLPVLGWMFKGRVPSTHHAADATWSKWAALITQWARIGNPSCPGILEVIMDWPEGKDFRMSEAPLYNKLPENEKQYALFTDGSCRVEGIGGGRLLYRVLYDKSQKLLKKLALDIAEQEKWPVLYLYTDSWMVANALWGWLQQWKQSNWQRRGKPIWAAALWQDIAARVENLVVKVHHVDAHVPKSQTTEEHQNNQQVDQAAKTEVAQVDLDWQHKGELFVAWWAHDTSGHQGRDATYRWARD
ncbi:LOW QUALITY PROTEIN: hypothetical protein QYF61_019837 [Mycteria americana]|uniref:ribonuclease H n=1 Tax=Mycteria americana TaxID=33587 RepID=A0AAN7S3Z2_MYCAM|nr:LOW QUALITY PROTEIN: hypothetical protein QYF61_019837 [Mycteria americana]